jgi:hypothetical protein
LIFISTLLQPHVLMSNVSVVHGPTGNAGLAPATLLSQLAAAARYLVTAAAWWWLLTNACSERGGVLLPTITYRPSSTTRHFFAANRLQLIRKQTSSYQQLIQAHSSLRAALRGDSSPIRRNIQHSASSATQHVLTAPPHKGQSVIDTSNHHPPL